MAQTEIYKMMTVMVEIQIHTMMIFSIHYGSLSQFFISGYNNILFETIWYVFKSRDLIETKENFTIFISKTKTS